MRQIDRKYYIAAGVAIVVIALLCIPAVQAVLIGLVTFAVFLAVVGGIGLAAWHWVHRQAAAAPPPVYPTPSAANASTSNPNASREAFARNARVASVVASGILAIIRRNRGGGGGGNSGINTKF